VPSATVSGTSYTPAQLRTVAAALDLFGEHGVAGTSLQMIADELRVTKAAVYHQFRTKDEIVLAVADVEMGPLVPAVEAAEAECSPERARKLLLEAMIDLAVQRRRGVRVMQSDPAIGRVLGHHKPFVELMSRLYGVLLGEDRDAGLRVRTAMVSATVGAALVHPLLSGLDDASLRAELLVLARRLLGLAAS
jgi:AcrR family transcriptional regulator